MSKSTDEILVEKLGKLMPNNPLGYIWYSLENETYASYQPLIKIMAKLVTRRDSQAVCPRIIELLSKVTRPPCINEICQYWTTTRNTELEKLIVTKGWVASDPLKAKVYTALKNARAEILLGNLTIGEIKLLAEATRDKDKEIAHRAREVLQSLSSTFFDKVVDAWMVQPLPILRDLLDSRDYLPRQNMRARVKLALQVERWHSCLLEDGPEIVPWLVECCEYSDRELSETAQNLLPRLENPAVQQAVCELVLRQDWPFAKKVALEKGWLPASPAERALFYFITEQWEKYDELDFDQRFLRLAYQAADQKFRQRLAAKVRVSGREEYVSALLGGEQHSRAGQLTSEEAELTVQILAANQNWPKLWSLVPLLPLKWSIEAVQRLDQAGWQGENEISRTTLAQLIALTRQALVTDPAEANQFLPVAVLRAETRLLHQRQSRVNALVFSPTAPLVALATTGGKVILWNIQTARVERVLVTPEKRSIGWVTFSQDGTLCWAERNNSTEVNCSIYFWRSSEGKIHKLGEHQGWITALETLGQDLLLSAGRDGRVALWNLKGAYLQKEIVSSQGWPRGLAVSHDHKKLAVLHEGATLYSLPDLTHLSETHFEDFGMVPKAVFSPDDKALVICKTESYLRAAAFDENGELSRKLEVFKKLALQGKHAIPGVAALPVLNLLLLGTETGKVEFIDWSDRRIIETLELRATNNYSALLTNLKVSPNGAFLALVNRDTVLSLWDLRLVALRNLFAASTALAGAGIAHLAAISVLREMELAVPAGLAATLRFIELVLTELKLRYEIELAEFNLPMIQAGDFDIELEG